MMAVRINLTLARWDELRGLTPGVPRLTVRRWLRGVDVLPQWTTELEAAATAMALTTAESVRGSDE